MAGSLLPPSDSKRLMKLCTAMGPPAIAICFPVKMQSWHQHCACRHAGSPLVIFRARTRRSAWTQTSVQNLGWVRNCRRFLGKRIVVGTVNPVAWLFDRRAEICISSTTCVALCVGCRPMDESGDTGLAVVWESSKCPLGRIPASGRLRAEPF